MKPLAYRCDASWWARPGQSFKYHLSGDGVTPVCGTRGLLIEGGIDPRTVAEGNRCRRCWEWLLRGLPEKEGGS